jgi:DNA-binding transcriptional LysR family regulator
VDLLRALECFRVVADELHFGRAAERLGMAQPPLSQRIRRLERELGAELFDRTSRRVRLTEAGQVLLAESGALLARVERTRTLVRKAHRGETGTLRAGMPPEVPGRTLAAVLTAFAADVPGVRLDLQELTTTEQLRLLADRQLDVGLLQQPSDLTGLTAGPVVDTPLGVVLPRDSPLATATGLRLADLSGHGLVLFPRAAAPGCYDALLASCRAAGFAPAPVLHARHPEFLLGLVASGTAVALDPGPVARKEPGVVWRPLTDGPSWRMTLAWPENTPHPAAPRFATTAARTLAADGTSTTTPASNATDPARPWSVVFGRAPADPGR